MFLHRVKMNWKRYQTAAEIILLVAMIRVFCEVCLRWAPLDYIRALELATFAIAGMAALAFLKSLWELGIAYHKKLRMFVVALRTFSRAYWSNKTTAVISVTPAQTRTFGMAEYTTRVSSETTRRTSAVARSQ
ncbi:MAG: hypothetical protein JOZ62_01385 [Acidobacteriaceae bacterium]|nr:hypothetical protein [Acidobacteriaceae bacterium]